MSRNTNEEFLSVLSQYDGSVDDRRKKYLQDTYGFSSNSALPSMEYQVLGDLGYTGTIDDRWSKYLKALGGVGLSSKAELLSSTFYGFYSANSLSPEFVLDFERETYLTDSTSSAFSEALTFTATGNRTMVDSDGFRKWAPHNLLTYSEDFTNADWLKSGATVTNVSDTLPSGISGSVARIEDSGTGTVYQSKFVSAGETYTIKLWAKRNSATDQTFRLFMSSNPVSDDLIATSEWQVFSFDIEVSEGGTRNVGITDDSGGGSYDILIWGAHFYRSDLGGMVNNPDRGDSYVPTTDSAVFLPRRGHHVYDGSQWVNKGLLLESESRTNLVTYSEDFTDASWTKTRASVSSNQSITPDGNTTADKLVEDTSLATTHLVEVSVPGSANDFTYSFWAKAAERTSVQVQRSSLETTGFAHIFDLSAGTAITVDGPGSANIEDYGNGFYKCSGTLSHPAATNTGIRIVLRDDSGSSVYDGDGTSGIYIWGAQLEQASTPSSYIPTSGSTVTRAGETLTAPSANLPWPEPVVIGEELVTNGTFDTDVSGWDTGSSASIAWASGAMEITNPVFDGYGFAEQAITTIPGAVYYYQVDVNSTGGNGLSLKAGTSSGGVDVLNQAPNTNTGARYGIFKATTATTYILVVNHNNNGVSVVDNISVREINPLAVSIAMEGEVTYADENSFEALFVWGDFSGKVETILDTRSTLTGSVQFGQKANDTASFISVESDVYSPGINVPFNVASRHGSTFINGAVDGSALTADTTPTALPDLSSTDLEIGSDFMGTIKSLRIWADDIGDDGIEEASS